MGVGAGIYMYLVVVKSSRSLSHLLMSSCTCSNQIAGNVMLLPSLYSNIPAHRNYIVSQKATLMLHNIGLRRVSEKNIHSYYWLYVEE